MAESIAAFPAFTLVPWVCDAGLGCLSRERMNLPPARSCSPFTAKRARLSLDPPPAVPTGAEWNRARAGGRCRAAGPGQRMRQRQRELGQGGAGITQHRLRSPYPICVIAAPPAALLAAVLRSPAGISPFWRMSSARVIRQPRWPSGLCLLAAPCPGRGSAGGDHSPGFRCDIRGTGIAEPGESSPALSLSRLGMLQILCPGSGWAQPGQESRSSSTAAHFQGLWRGLGCQAGVPGCQGRSSLC